MGKTQKIVGLALLILAIVLAVYAWVVSSRMNVQQRAAQPKMQPVVVAQARIPAGTVIAPAMLKVEMFPARPVGAYADVATVVGNVATADIAAGEAILPERLGGGLRALLQHVKPDERAVAIRVDEVVAVGNRLVPGDMVDVFASLHRNQNEIANTQSRLVLEKLQVLAFGPRDVGSAGKAGTSSASAAQASERTPKTAVLAVKTTDVDKLILAAENGRLILALRPPVEAAETAPGVPGTGATTVAATQVAQASPQPLLLKQFMAETGPSSSARPVGRQGVRQPRGDSVIVMYGLKEHRTLVTARDGGRP